MNRVPPMAPCLALLRVFDPDNPRPQNAIALAAASLQDDLPDGSFNDLNTGQFAALTDRVIDMGLAAFQASRLRDLVAGGNLTLPVYEFKTYGKRGLAELDVWLAGNAS
jgi:hypothetical protein